MARRVLALIFLALALIACVALAASESLTNRTGRTATAVTVTFSEQVRITSYDETVFPMKDPSSRSETFRFSGGQLENGARFSVSWIPSTAEITSAEWETTGATGEGPDGSAARSFPAWLATGSDCSRTSMVVLSRASRSEPAYAGRDITELGVSVCDSFVVVRLTLRGAGIASDIRQWRTRYIVRIMCPDWENRSYHICLPGPRPFGDGVEYSDRLYAEISEGDTGLFKAVRYVVEGTALLFAVPREYLEPFEALVVDAEARRFPDDVEDYIRGEWPAP